MVGPRGWRKSAVVLGFVIASATTLGVAPAAAKGTTADYVPSEVAAEHEAQLLAPQAPQRLVAPEFLEIGAAALTEGVDYVSDGQFDVFNGGADVVAAGIETDTGGTISAAMIVDVYVDPYSSPDWVFGITSPSWEFDTNLDGVRDFNAAFFNIGGVLSGSVFDSASNIVCPVSIVASAVNSGYGVGFPASCIGNPQQFGWRAVMRYDDVSLAMFEIDFAPNFGWAGPMPNTAYNPPPPPPPPPPSPPDGSPLVTVTPARLFDSRPIGARVAGSVTEVQVAGRGGVPVDAVGAMLNVTVVEAQAPGFATVYPCGEARPDASNLNYGAGQTIPNAVAAKLGAAGSVCIFTFSQVQLLVDVNGYVPAGSDVSLITPARLLDSRPTGVRPGGTLTTVQVAGAGGVPVGSKAAMLNVTVVEAQAPGFATVYPCDQPRPDASNLNYGTGSTIPNAVFAKLSAAGTVCVYTYAAVHLLVDVNGYVPAGSSASPVNPFRALDSRSTGGVRPGGSVTTVQIAGSGGVPIGSRTAMLNVTVVEAQAPGFATVYPCDQPRPDASNLNYGTGSTIPNAVFAKLSAAGTVCVYTYAAVHLLVDVNGYVP